MNDHPADKIVLRTEKSRASIPLLRVVIGGVAARGPVSVDQLDDLQLAVESLVVEERSYSGDLVLEMSIEKGRLSVRLGGLSNAEVKALLQSPSGEGPPRRRRIDVRMLLDALVDGYSVVESADGRFAVQIEKWTP